LARRKTYYLLQVHKITGRTERSFPKSTGFELPKGIHEFEPAALSYTIFGIRTLIGIARTGTFRN
jgi:hypothetical protein